MSAGDALIEGMAEAVARILLEHDRKRFVPDEGLSAAAVAKMLGIAKGTLANFKSSEPDFPAKLPGGVYSRKAIERWMELRSWPKSRRRGRR